MTEDRAYNSARNRQNSAIGFLVPGVAAQKSRQSPPTPEPGTARSSRSSPAHYASLTQIALAWLLRRSPMMLPIPETSSIEHLEQNVAAASLRLAEGDYEELSRVPDLVASLG